MAKISAKAFDHLSNLTTLDLSHNKLSILETDYMAKLTNLKVLNISGHPQMNLMEIKPTFQIMTELRVLSMADMGSLPIGIFIPLSHIKVLNISGNHISNETLQILNPLIGLKVCILFFVGRSAKRKYIFSFMKQTPVLFMYFYGDFTYFLYLMCHRYIEYLLDI